jgi:hypothetical protein
MQGAALLRVEAEAPLLLYSLARADDAVALMLVNTSPEEEARRSRYGCAASALRW